MMIRAAGLVYLGLVAPAMILPARSAERPGAASFQKIVQPFLAKHCLTCHNEKSRTGNLTLEGYSNAPQVSKDRELWERVADKIESGEMPPKGLSKPDRASVQAVAGWIRAEFDRADRALKPDPGRVTARRLNKAEYNNTVRDLLGVDFRPADDFPADDSGYGFDNIGDVLSLPPVLMEKYLAAAGRISRAAVAVKTTLRPTLERLKAERPDKPAGADAVFAAVHRFPAEADYEIRLVLGGRRPKGASLMRAALMVDGHPVELFEVDPGQDKKRLFDLRMPVTAGEHTLRAEFVDDKEKPADAGHDRTKNVVIDGFEIRGPYNAKPLPLPAAHKKIFICGHGLGEHQASCARTSLADLARRAWRRPVTAKEVERLAGFVEMARNEGDSFEAGMRVAVQAILLSPNFLFRLERDPNSGEGSKESSPVRAVGDFELASRLSYFLWSSMPDEELLGAAQSGALRRPGVLEAQARRMLRDPKARALVENFGGQWLQLRNLASLKPDPDRFPNFDAGLKAAMQQETELFFLGILQEDRSVLEFLDSRYTFLNERLAKHYGIGGVSGEAFRKVELAGGARGGVITQASILALSSYPTRTSPVIRGKWILENILNAPPPPPPANVPNLNEEAVGSTGSLRKQLEQHRSNATCNSCHGRMDPLGFGLENYDAIGAWRTMDGRFPIDASGVLPDGKSFQGPAELRRILLDDKDAFARGLTGKLLTYALGRGLERYDRLTVNAISRKLAANGYRFSTLVSEIVNSAPFRMRRGEVSESAQR